MLDTLLSKKIFLAGFSICVLLVAGSLVYYESVKRETRKQEASTQRFLNHLKTQEVDGATQHPKPQGPESIETEEVHLADDAAEIVSEPTERSFTENVDFTEGGEDLFAEETAETDKVPVSPYGISPYGFGPYPVVPTGFPEHLMPVWTWSEAELERIVGRQKDFELMHRVLIKLWNQGYQDFVGVTRGDDNGKVYPIYPNIAYVTWRESKDPRGIVRYRYPGLALSGPKVPRLTAIDFAQGRGYPAHVTVLDRETAGIEPYQFLDLQR